MRGAYSRRVLREKNHSSHGGRKAYLNFELKDQRPPEAARLRRVLCVGHVRQLGGESPLCNLMEVKH
jgi:hypothetical protein